MTISNTINLILAAAALTVVVALPACADQAPRGAARSTQFLNLPGGRIAYDDTGGTGPLVICVPGLGDVRQQYRFLAPRLVAAGFRVVTMDLPGHGDSSADWPAYSPAIVGADIVAMIRHLGAGKAFVVGNSMAGGSAVWAAAEIPDRVAGIVLIDPFTREMPTSSLLLAFLKVAMMRPWGPSFWSMYYGSLYKTAPPADLDSYRAALVANLKQPGRIEATKAMIFASQGPCEARIPQVHAPVLVVMGTRDSDFDDPAAEADWVATHLHGEKLMVQGAGHYPHVEYPDVVANAVVDFMKEAQDGEARRN
ncbi:MAG TPA: alpha/beta hydrolase [Candidatus Binatus sp.]|uniref:alpha/beta fold hydrolase n=1 Tax=Candidatus Binatus sp. TaxID=2811406 RepID=UPI002F410768